MLLPNPEFRCRLNKHWVHAAMKNTTKTITKRLAAALVLLSSATSFAGEPVMMPMEPAPAPSLWSWFAGGSVGYLNDFEEEFYSVHVGAEKFSGETSHAIFLEVGYAEYDETIFGISVDVDFVPVTLNYKFERPLFGCRNLNWYASAGVGVLFADLDVDYDADRDGRTSGGSDEVLMAQAGLGLAYNLGTNFEIYGGGRWVWFDDVDAWDGGDDIMGEIGLRYNF